MNRTNQRIPSGSRLVAVAAIGLLAACASTIDVASMPRETLPVVSTKPPETSRRQVLVPSFEKHSDAKAIALGATALVERQVERIVQSAGAEVVDRSRYDDAELRGELENAENMGKRSVRHELATDTIMGRISGVELTAQFNAARKWKDNDGKVHRVPPSCTYEAQVAGTLEAFSMNPMVLRDTIHFSGVSSTQVETRDKSCPIADGVLRQLVTSAAREAMKAPCAKLSLKDLFGPVAYVVEYRADPGDDDANFFRLSIGPREGAKAGLEAQIMSMYEFVDPVSGKKTLEPEVVAEGEIVTDKSGRQAYVHVKEGDRAKRVKAGDLVQIRHEKSMADYLSQAGSLVNQGTTDTCKPTS